MQIQGTCEPKCSPACKATEQGITNKCAEIFEMANKIDGFANDIDSKLFGPKPCQTSDIGNFSSIDDYLDAINNVMMYTYNALTSICNKL